MPATVGGIIEQRDFGISISLDGNNINDVELNSSNELQLKADGTLLKDTGEWISKVIDIGDKFESYGKVFSTHIDNNGSVVTIQTRTSLNGNVWEDWKAVGLDGSILSTKQQFIQIKLVFHAGYGNQVVDLGSAFNSEYVDTTNGIKVNRDYVRTMIKDSGYTDEGSLHKITIDKSEFAKVDSVNVPQVASEINKSLILHGGEYKKWLGRTDSKETIETKITNTASSDVFDVTASAVYQNSDSYSAWKLFDNNYNNTSSRWIGGSTYPQWVRVHFKNEDKIINRYKIAVNSANHRPSTWKLQGSNDGNVWEDLHSVENYIFTDFSVLVDFSFVNHKAYSYYQLYIIKGDGGTANAITINEFRLVNLSVAKEPHYSIISNALPSSQQFLTEGMDSLSPLLDRKETELEPVLLESKSGILQGDEEGKTFSTTIDLKRLIDIKEIKVEVE